MYTRFALSAPRTLRYLRAPIVFITLYAAVIYFAYRFGGIEHIAIPLSVPTVLGTAISILLGFRTGSDYDRWWEARKIWGSIINDSRSLVRQAIGFFSNSNRSANIREIAQKQIAWCYALNHSLRDLPMPDEVQQYLSKEEYERVVAQDNIPNAILQLKEEKLVGVHEDNGLDTYQFTSMDRTLKDLCNHMGMCERINKTVFPVQYSYFTRLAILIFMLILPFGMVDVVGVFVIPITLVVIFFFTMIEIIARFLQDPFENRASDIPMTTICRSIEINLLEMIGEKELPEKISPDKRGIIM